MTEAEYEALRENVRVLVEGPPRRRYDDVAWELGLSREAVRQMVREARKSSHSATGAIQFGAGLSGAPIGPQPSATPCSVCGFLPREGHKVDCPNATGSAEEGNCPTCGAEPGSPCLSSHGGTSDG